ncbi:MAG: HlyD family efflux transporter periplasmic adaptor subunit [Planctomycetales bacterium]
MRRIGIIPIISLGLVLIAVYHIAKHSQAQPPTAPPANPARSPYGLTIAGAGVIEPQSENVSIGTHVAGIVHKVHVKVGDRIKTGAPLFSLDDRHLQAELTVRKAALASFQAQLTRLQQQPRPEELPGSKSKVSEAQARLQEEQDRFARSEKLVERKAITREDFVVRRQALKVSEAQLSRVEAEDTLLRAGAWGPDKEVAAAAVEQAQAQLQQTMTEIERLTVNSPLEGEVLQVNVRPGEFVGQQPGQTLLTIGRIQPFHVRVDIDEHDIPRFRPQSAAVAVPRGAEDHKLPLKFVRVEPMVIPKKSLTGSNSERVDTRVLQVIYALEPKDLPVFCGQQVDVFIELSSTPASKTEPTTAKELVER